MNKKLFFVISFCISFFISFADSETISTLLNNGTWETNYPNVPALPPCGSVPFKVNYSIPSGYTSVKQFDWYVNSILVFTSTTVSTDANGIQYGGYPNYIVRNAVNSMVCKVTYQNSTQTIAKSSAAFIVNSQLLNVGISYSGQIVNNIPSIPLGCRTAVTFSTYTYSCNLPNNACDNITSSSYNVQWVPPANWTLLNSPANGQTASFIPDAATGGTLTANIVIGCNSSVNYIFPIGQNISRSSPPPSFATSNSYLVCTGTTSKNFSINSLCGVTGYTYTIQGNAGCVFSSNNTQTFTTTATTVGIAFPQISGSITLSVKANYPGNVSSVNSTVNIYIGTTPAPTGLELNDINCPEYNFSCFPSPPGITSYSWSYYNTTTHVLTPLPSNSTSTKIVFTTNGTYNVGVAAVSACGTSTSSYLTENVTCGTSGHSVKGAEKAVTLKSDDDNSELSKFPEFTIYPNPTTNEAIIDLGYGNTKGKLKGIKSVYVYSSLGVNVGIFNYSELSQIVHLNIANFSSGVYVVKVSDGVNSISKKLVVQK